MSLWSVIEAMQRRLEGEGLDHEVVDAAVTRGIEALLRGSRRRREQQQPLFLASCAADC